MPSYVFRAHQGSGDSDVNVQCWKETKKIDDGKLMFFPPDPLTKDSAKVGTSIPTPFARLHLFKTAFGMVNNHKGDNPHVGSSPYHELVSDCLDMMQMLFINSHKELSFQAWNKKNRLEVLEKKGLKHPHKQLAETIKLYTSANGSNNPLSLMEDFVMIKYDGQLVGGTSPFTLFFTSPNWRRYVKSKNLKISFGTNDVLFDDEYKALHERDIDFQEFVHKYALAHHVFLGENGGNEFRQYVEESAKFYGNESLFLKRNKEWNESFRDKPESLARDAQYQPVNFKDSPTNLAIAGKTYYMLAPAVKQKGVSDRSDFKIKISDYCPYLQNQPGVAVPLALVHGMSESGEYVDGKWDPNIPVQQGVLIPLHKRRLPKVDIIYPWITVSDFLEETLIKLPFTVNKDRFFTATAGKSNFLLPIKKEYFNFFSPEDLMKNLSISNMDNKVTVNLKVPLTGKIKELTFTKTYDLPTYHGNAVQSGIGMGFFPFYQVTDNEKLNEQTVLVADMRDEAIFRDLAFFKATQPERAIREVQRNTRSEKKQDRLHNYDSIFFTVPQSYDYIEASFDIDGQSLSGLIVPQFTKVELAKGSNKFAFAIDFGTSNTHVAYIDNNSNMPVGLSVGEKDMQMVLLNAPDRDNKGAEQYRYGFGDMSEMDAVIKREFVPPFIGEGDSFFSFPTRTTTCEKSTFEREGAHKIFGNINIGFSLDTEEVKLDQVTFITNLKWRFEYSKNIEADKLRLMGFLKEIMLLIKHKVLLNKGNLAETRIGWTYPNSMKMGIRNSLSDAMKSVVKDTFAGFLPTKAGDGPGLQSPMSEAEAPFYYLVKHLGIIRDDNIVNIDIGGGTTDIVFFLNNDGKRLVTTSFRFAGNDIWGSGYNNQERMNGFLSQIVNNRDSKGKQDNVLQKMLKDNDLRAEDIINFLFRHDEYFHFSDNIRLGNPNLQLVLFMHYAAIIYHLVQMIEKLEIDIPPVLSFTGMGSRYIKLIMPDADVLEDFTTKLFKSYTNKRLNRDFKILLHKRPKEATANGVLASMHENRDHYKNNKKELILLGGKPGEGFDEVPEGDPGFFNQTLDNAILGNLNSFFTKTFQNQEIRNFLKYYYSINIDGFKDELERDHTLDGMFRESYRLVCSDIKEKSQELTETLFFYAFKNALRKIGDKAANVPKI